MNNTSININFRGFGVKDAIPTQTVKKFLNNENNIKLIDELDQKNVDVFMASKGSELHFISQKYGDLEKYGLLPELAEEAEKISANISKFLKKVDKACLKAYMDRSKQKQEQKKEKFLHFRGC